MKTKTLCAILFIFTKTIYINAQIDTLYYNSYWYETIKERAEYFRPKPVKN